MASEGSRPRWPGPAAVPDVWGVPLFLPASRDVAARSAPPLPPSYQELDQSARPAFRGSGASLDCAALGTGAADAGAAAGTTSATLPEIAGQRAGRAGCRDR